MDMSFINVANNMHAMAVAALDRRDVEDAYRLLEMSITSALMTGAEGTRIRFLLRPPELLPHPTVSPEHVMAVISAQEVTLYAWAEFVTKPLFTYERFPVVGDLLARVARTLEPEQQITIVVDFGDGHDVGDYPRVAFSSSLPQALLVPDPYLYYNDDYAPYRQHVAEQALPWRQRKDQLFWRGGSGSPRLSAPNPADPLDWNSQQRLQLLAAVKRSRHRDRLDVALSHVKTIEEDYLRQAVTHAGFLKPPVDKPVFLDYRYQLDIDGWSNSWSLLDKLISGSCILKVASPSGFRQWFYDKLEPWKHYVPVTADLSDLDAAMDWALNHEDEAEQIAQAAQDVAATIRLEPDLQVAARAISTRLALL